MAEYIEREATCKGCVRYGMGETLCADCVVKVAPAADVAPVVHAKWDTVFFQRHEGELASYTHVCPGCKFLYRNLRSDGYNHCPNCGARMDLED